MSGHIVIRRKRVTDVASEASWGSVVHDWATLHGWWAWHLPDSRRTPAGLPDWLLIRVTGPGVGRVVFIEIKVPGGRLRKAQREVIAMLEQCSGVEMLTAVFPDDWPRVRDALV